MDRHLKILDTLIAVAKSTQHHFRANHAAAIVYKGRFLAVGINQKKSDPFHVRFASNDKAIFIHAETDCIKQVVNYFNDALYYLKNSTLYVVRVKGEDKTEWGLSKPCIGCLKAVDLFNIKKVIYSKDNQGYGTC